MEDLPAKLTIDILSRLPVKTVIHCKCVCKKWWNLVLDSSFVNLHLSRSPTSTGFIIHYKPRICDNPGILKWVEIEDKVDHRHLHYDRLLTLDLLNLGPIYTEMRQVGLVNGLICLWEYSYEVDNTYICNPVTREYMILPRQRYQTDGFSGVVYGFGVSSLTGEYKVVRAFHAKTFVQNGVTRAGQPSVLEAEVYTLGTGQWRSLPPVPVTYRLNTLDQFCGPFLNNHCHWIVSDNQDANDDKICTFDLDKETFQLFPSPPKNENRFHRQSLGILKGCLRGRLLDTCPIKAYRVNLPYKANMTKTSKCLTTEMAAINSTEYLNFNQNQSMEDLPTELTIDILSRLPVKTIFHCKRVCKKWWNLVLDSSFVNLHLSISPTSLIVHQRVKYLCDGSLDSGYFKWVEIGDKVDDHHLQPMEVSGGPPYTLYRPDVGTVLNDHFHWVASDGDAPERICTFDLNKEKFQLFPSPPSEEESDCHFQSLAVLKGSLCKSDGNDSQFTIWMMKEYAIKKSWHKEVVITKEALNCS
ncbi:hypothetical protein OSB04_016197 [Centaurea solstitialis]|uniref:F-box domain-containing protein n=1 Tax=Centaurea solstitialis TaxID=347529 RepID=A0AA38W9K9_9ASTR|nr:hypothetical protein OSB04_016197 [Centaurea solstitialis]